jgi:hypothetical protein
LAAYAAVHQSGDQAVVVVLFLAAYAAVHRASTTLTHWFVYEIQD